MSIPGATTAAIMQPVRHRTQLTSPSWRSRRLYKDNDCGCIVRKKSVTTVALHSSTPASSNVKSFNFEEGDFSLLYFEADHIFLPHLLGCQLRLRLSTKNRLKTTVFCVSMSG